MCTLNPLQPEPLTEEESAYTDVCDDKCDIYYGGVSYNLRAHSLLICCVCLRRTHHCSEHVQGLRDAVNELITLPHDTCSMSEEQWEYRTHVDTLASKQDLFPLQPSNL